MGIMSFFSGNIETSDHHNDALLRTHYYKATKEKILGELETLINKEPSLSMIEVSKERGEAAANVTKGKKGLLVITVIGVGPFKTAVDITFSVDRGFVGGFGRRLVQKVYAQLEGYFPKVS